jgi:hypothetical protein
MTHPFSAICSSPQRVLLAAYAARVQLLGCKGRGSTLLSQSSGTLICSKAKRNNVCNVISENCIIVNTQRHKQGAVVHWTT